MFDLGGLGGALGGGLASLISGSGGERERNKAPKLFEELIDPPFDMSDLTAPELRSAGQYNPETYESVATEVQGVEDSPALRAAQLQALGQLQQIGQEGLPLSERLAAQEQQRGLAQTHKGLQEAALQGLAARGRLSGGMELAARMAAGQQSSELARGQGADLAQMAVGNRLRGIADSGQLAGQVRGQDQQQRLANSEMINRYNMALTGRQEGAAANAAQARNQAQLYNLGERQRIADTNVSNRYGTAQYNQANQNSLKQNQFGNQLARASGQANALQHKAKGQDAKLDQRIGLGRGLGRAVGDFAGLAATTL